ncbi:MAG: hypothetical protein WDN04_08850 [Rhodospirillales bacterium]
MNELRVRIEVGPDRKITGIAPEGVPPGTYEGIIEVAAPARKRLRVSDLPVHDLP